MRPRLISLALGSAAAVPFAPTAQAQEAARPEFRSHRFDEDWRLLCDPAQQTDPLDRLKCIDLSEGLTLTLGGELRERIEAVDNPGFGLEQDDDRAFLTRAMLHADLRLRDSVRVFVQMGGFFEAGRREGPEPTDVDRLDLVQGFVDVSAPLLAGEVTLRAGRQELSFGSQRLFSVREGPNVRRAFDGVRAFWAGSGVRIDTFYLRPVLLRPDVFDDETNEAERFYGIHLTAPIRGALNADLYLIDYQRRVAEFAIDTGREQRWSLGTRLFGEASGWDWDIEAVYQWGRFHDLDIRAWTIATDIGFTLDAVPLSPRLGLKADIASGDDDPADGKLGTFNALYPKFPYFSEANLVAPANLMDLNPNVTIQPSERLELSFGWNALWRQTRRDSIYEPQLAPLVETSGRPGRFIGHQTIVGLEWEPSRAVKLSGQYVHFERGTALRSVGGRDVDFAVVAVAFKF